MIFSANFTNFPEELSRFHGKDDMMQTLRHFSCSGIELNYAASCALGYIDASMVNSVHLPSPPAWVDLWLGKEDALLEEYGDRETLAMYFDGATPDAFIKKIKTAMDMARDLEAKYVVFHVCEVRLWELYTRTYAYTNREVAHETAMFLNEVMRGEDYPFELLLENLWWPGLTFHDPEIPWLLLDEVAHPRTGFVLDTGHMMNSNRALRTSEEAVCFIEKVLGEQRDILPHIRAVHLCESLSGEYAQKVIDAPPAYIADYHERYRKVFSDIFQIDQHRPITCDRYKELLALIDPAYVVHELITSHRDEWEKKMTTQCRHLGLL